MQQESCSATEEPMAYNTNIYSMRNTHIHTHTHTHIYTQTHTDTQTHARMHTCTYTHTHAHAHTWVHGVRIRAICQSRYSSTLDLSRKEEGYLYICTRKNICTYASRGIRQPWTSCAKKRGTCIYACMHRNIYMYVYTHMNICINVFTYIYVYVHTHTHAHTQKNI